MRDRVGKGWGRAARESGSRQVTFAQISEESKRRDVNIRGKSTRGRGRASAKVLRWERTWHVGGTARRSISKVEDESS